MVYVKVVAVTRILVGFESSFMRHDGWCTSSTIVPVYANIGLKRKTTSCVRD